MCSHPDKIASVHHLLPILSGAAIYALLELTGLEHPWLPTLLGVAVCGASLLFGKKRWFWSSSLAALLLVLLICKSRFLDGFCQWHNIFVDRCIVFFFGAICDNVESFVKRPTGFFYFAYYFFFLSRK